MKDDQLRGIGLTLGAMALTAVVFVLSQLQACIVERPMLKKQIDYFTEKYDSSKSAIKDNQMLLKSREEQCQQMAGVEVKYTNLIGSLMELAKTDQDAHAIALKWKIQVSGQPVTSPSRISDTSVPDPRESKVSGQATRYLPPASKGRNVP
jgi:hypothetical protein